MKTVKVMSLSERQFLYFVIINQWGMLVDGFQVHAVSKSLFFKMCCIKFIFCLSSFVLYVMIISLRWEVPLYPYLLQGYGKS